MRYVNHLTTLLSILLLSHYAVAQGNVTLSGLDIAVETLHLIDDMRNPDGSYEVFLACDSGGCRPQGSTLRQGGGWAVLAYASLFEVTGDERYLQRLRSEMDDLMKTCPTDDVVDCIFMGVQVERAYNLTGEKKYLAYFENVDRVRVFYLPDVMMKSILARELAIKAKYVNDTIPHDSLYVLEKAEQAHNASTNILYSKNDVSWKMGGCWLQLARLELYALTRDDESIQGRRWYNRVMNSTRLISEVRFFFDSMDFSEEAQNPILNTVSSMDYLSCVDSLKWLSELTGEEKYSQDASVLLDSFLNSRWDSSITRKYDGDNTFMASGCIRNPDGVITCHSNAKFFSDNMYALHLFARHADKTFTLSTGNKVQYHSDITVSQPSLQRAHSRFLQALLILALAFITTITYIKAKRRRDI
ncbi:MAG: hypothetical protein ABH834_03400 [Candidatus Altiarchaeota archaeon]